MVSLVLSKLRDYLRSVRICKILFALVCRLNEKDDFRGALIAFGLSAFLGEVGGEGGGGHCRKTLLMLWSFAALTTGDSPTKS